MRSRPLIQSVFFNLPWLVLILVACIQIFLASTAELSAWKGGGFGMFAKDVDRQVKVFGLQRGEDGLLAEEEIKVHPRLQRTTKNYPSEAKMRWLLEQARRGLQATGHRTDSLRAELWRVTYDPQTKTLARTKERTVFDKSSNHQTSRR